MVKIKKMGILLFLLLVGLALLSCGSSGDETADDEAEQYDMYEDFAPVVTASGVVVPEQWATLSFKSGGRVVKVYVAEGDEVEGGTLLAKLDDTDQRNAVRQAEASLAIAQAQLAQLRAEARPEDITAAEAARDTARAQLSIAENNLRAVQVDVRMLEAEVAVAESNLRVAQAGLLSAQGNITVTLANLRAVQAQVAEADAGIDAAEAQLDLTRMPARAEEIRQARLQMEKAEAALKLAQSDYDEIAWVGGVGSTPQALALEQATLDYELAKSQYELLAGRARDEEVAVAQAGVAAAEARAETARSQVDVAQAQLDVTTTTAARAQVDIARTRLAMMQQRLEQGRIQAESAQAQVSTARAGLAQAQAQLEKLQNGATAEDIAVSEAQVAQAETALKYAQDALAETELYAPFDGTITNVYVRESEQLAMGMGGDMPVMVIGDLTRLQVKTTDLNEVDIARVQVGQSVEITFDALVEKMLTGRVKKIAPRATEEAGGTNFTVWIQFDEVDPALRWDMTAFVDIFVE